jgi:uncharacterized protein (DUF934 family)
MPTLIRLVRESAAAPTFAWGEDPFLDLLDDLEPGAAQALLVSLPRFQAEGDAWLAEGRRIGVRVAAEEDVEGLAYDLARLSLVALAFPKFRDGRAYSSAALLRGRYQYAGELRAVGDVLRDQAAPMVRCGFDAFVPADGSTPEAWAASALRHRHVYQAAFDGRPPAFVEREAR